MPKAKTPIVAHVNLLWCAHQRVGGSEEYLIRQLAGLQQALSEHGEPEISCTVHLGRRLAAERHELDSFTQVVSRCDVDRQATRSPLSTQRSLARHELRILFITVAVRCRSLGHRPRRC